MQTSMDFSGILGFLNPFNWFNYSNQKEQQRYQRQQDSLNRQMQYDFAQNSVKWRVNDAKEAGLHPLAALGVSPSSASPVYSSSEAPQNPLGGQLVRAQLDLIRSEVDKNKAEASAIAGQNSSINDPSGIQPKTLSTPEKVARVSENVTGDTRIKKSFQVEPSQPEYEKYESMPFLLGAMEYLRNYHFGGYDNLQAVKPEIEANLRKMAKKQGEDFDAEYSLVIRGNKIQGYTLDLIPHEHVDSFISAGDKWSRPTSKGGWNMKDDFLSRSRKR